MCSRRGQHCRVAERSEAHAAEARERPPALRIPLITLRLLIWRPRPIESALIVVSVSTDALCPIYPSKPKPPPWEELIKLPRRQFLQFGAGAAALPPISRFARAETFPSRRITVVVPFPPGALTNNIARTLAEGMRISLGQSIIVENVGGADGTIRAPAGSPMRLRMDTRSSSAPGTHMSRTPPFMRSNTMW